MPNPPPRIIRATNPKKIPPKVFTSISNIGILRVLANNVKVEKRFGNMPTPISKTDYVAVWDTGATNTCITPKLAKDINSAPTGMRKIIGANSLGNCPTHIVSIQLPNEVIIEKIKVTELTFGGGDVLIGMDIIAMGDFAVSNFNGTTKFTFRIPSLGHFDFAQNVGQGTQTIQTTVKTTSKIGRNQPCPCGSRKKYKYCCGK